ncbi:MAG TPA: hypothetical protein VGX00_00850 [Thermoplasmata archaeon]|nr:hypothetical protein [Thermoplasmata archaeon]
MKYGRKVTMVGAEEERGPEPSAWRAARDQIAHALPPARLTWLCLAVLGTLSVVYFGGLGIVSILLLPWIALIADLAFQSVRFEEVRFPDAAIATGLFVALLIPPTVSYVAAGTVTFAAIGVKHVLRFKGRPILNPAASGVVIGTFLFGMAPAWWAGVGPLGSEVLVALGAAMVARNPSGWRLPAMFFGFYAPLSVAMKVIVGAALAPKVLVLGVLDPATLFFGLFMVVEPRTAPANPLLHPLYAALVATAAAFLPLVMPGPGVLVALLIVNLGAVLMRAVGQTSRASSESVGSGRARSPPVGPRGHRRREGRLGRTPGASWSAGRRAVAGVAVLVLVGIVAATTYVPTSTPSVSTGVPPHAAGGGGGPAGSGGSHNAVSCAKDSPSVDPSTLQALHHALGPSVILSYDANSGTTVFYDPVNSVTVTETDLYEDYGSAEFNGDDFAVSGCSP